MMTEEAAKALRAPFAPEQVGKLPRKGVPGGLSYVGHAAVTDRLLSVDPAWTWEPTSWADDGSPLIRYEGNEAKLWIRLTVCGVSRIGCGIVNASAMELEKQLISDAIRNAAMRFGVALDLWAKENLAAEPVVDADRIDALKTAIGALPDSAAAELKAWKDAHDFPWPWPVPVCEAIEAEIDRILGNPF